MYLDTCIERGRVATQIRPCRPAAAHYALREEPWRCAPANARAPTAVLTHGANPGLVNRTSFKQRCSHRR